MYDVDCQLAGNNIVAGVGRENGGGSIWDE